LWIANFTLIDDKKRKIVYFLEKDSLTKDEALNCGQQITSKNQAYRCAMQVWSYNRIFLKKKLFFNYS
jgi:hypothetical protein